MTDPTETAKVQPPVTPAFDNVVEILGGQKVLKRKLRTQLDAHELLLRGLPSAVLTHMVDNLVILHDPASLAKAVGVSLRTLQRRKASPSRLLNQEQSGRTWKFAEVVARATKLLGSRTEAEQWLDRPAIGLDQRRPIDLLSTPAGVEIVETYLDRLTYGVYA